MPPKLNSKIIIFIIILFILNLQLNKLVDIYKQARFNFDVPTPQHLQKTPIESEAKAGFKHLQHFKEIDHFEHEELKEEEKRTQSRFRGGAVSSVYCFPEGMFY